MHLCLCLLLFVVLGSFCAVFDFAHLEFYNIYLYKYLLYLLLVYLFVYLEVQHVFVADSIAILGKYF